MKRTILLLILLKYTSTNNVWDIQPEVSSSSSSSSLPPSSIKNQIDQTTSVEHTQTKHQEIEVIDNQEEVERFNPKIKTETIFDKNYDSHRSKESANSFFITTFNKLSDMATNFTNKFKTPLKLTGTYEICLHQIVFKNTLEIELGELEIHFNEHKYAKSEDTKNKSTYG